MLVLSRQRDESILIGDEFTAIAKLTPRDTMALQQCTDPALLDLAERLLATRGPIEIVTVDIRGDKVRLGVSAPKAVAVHRQEVFEDIRRGRKAATDLAGTEARR